MMAGVRRVTDRLIDRLPPVRGRYIEDAPLGGMTWFRVGGPAEVLFTPADADDLAAFLRAKPVDVPVTVVGLGANMLVRDGGVPGVVVHLGRAFSEIEVVGHDVRAGAGAVGLKVANAAADAGVAGLEFLAGIPGTVGGALRMNAGAYGSEVSDVFISATALDDKGCAHTLDRVQMGFAYRFTAVSEDWIFISAHLRGRPSVPEHVFARIAEIRASREASQPIRTRTGGSTFKNPIDPRAHGARAWELIDRAGCRGLVRGGAMVSDMHCNFLINTGTATAADLEELGEEVRRRVFEATGVALEWEIRRVGLPRGAKPREGGA